MRDETDRPNVGPRVRGLLALLAVGSALLAGWLVSILWTPLERGVESWLWPATDAEVLTAYWHEEHVPGRDIETDTRSWLGLTYAYTVDEPTGFRDHRVSTRFDASSPNRHSRTHQRSVAARGMGLQAIAAAPVADVRVDPDDPSFAVLQPGIPFGTSILMLYGVLAAGLAFGLGRIAFDGRFSLGRPPTELPEGQPPREAALLLWFLSFGMGGLLLATLGALVCEWGLARPLPGWPLAAFCVVYGSVLPFPRLLATRPVAWLSVGLFLLSGALFFAAFPIGIFAERGRVAFDAADPVLVERLQSDHPEVVISAAYEVRDRYGPDAAERHLVAAKGHHVERVRDAAGAALVELRKAQARRESELRRR